MVVEKLSYLCNLKHKIMKVENLLEIYEINGSATPLSNKPILKIKGYWGGTNFIDIEIEDRTYTVIARELKRAFENAVNE